MKLVLLALCLVVAGASGAAAYPQFQLGHDPTCTGCHISPAGGGLLNENGMAVAESISKYDAKAAFAYGAVELPKWLQLGADVRGAAGMVDPGTPLPAGFPMQIEGAARAETHGFSVNVLAGFRSPSDGNGASPLHALWSRQHYVEWESNPGDNEGFYLRAGRLAPVFGLRLAEHVAYTQRYGGEPLYDEAYGAVASYVTKAFEVHASGFVHDPLDVTTEHGDGGAFYAEVRLGEHAAIGADAKYSKETDQTRMYAGGTAKLYLPAADLQLQGELVAVRAKVTADGMTDARTELAAYALASRPLGGGFLLDIGGGHYTQDTRVKGLYRDCVDANVHWFQSSHVEWLLTTRLELLDGGGGPNGGWVLAQFHYRL